MIIRGNIYETGYKTFKKVLINKETQEVWLFAPWRKWTKSNFNPLEYKEAYDRAGVKKPLSMIEQGAEVEV